jgi:hypothetical protein
MDSQNLDVKGDSHPATAAADCASRDEVQPPKIQSLSPRKRGAKIQNGISCVETRHYFDFEAVIIYLNRWSLVDRWARYNGEAAVERFRKLVDSGIEKFTDVFA